MTAKTTYRDRRRAQVEAAAALLDRLEVAIGFQGRSGLRPVKVRRRTSGKRGRRPKRLVSGRLRMVDLAAIHEFGSRKANIPERSFLRATFNDHSFVRAAKLPVVQAAAKGRNPLRQARIMGLKLQAAVQKTLTDLKSPPLAASTLAQRLRRTGDSDPNPLVDTGQLRSSISYVIKLAGARVAGSRFSD